MRGTVKIGEKDVEMVANAASPYLFKEIFHIDFLKEAQAEQPDVSLFEKMGFVMAKQAEGLSHKDFLKLDASAYIDWLTGFEPLDVITAAGDISSLYMGQEKSTSVPKRKGE